MYLDGCIDKYRNFDGGNSELKKILESTINFIKIQTADEATLNRPEGVEGYLPENTSNHSKSLNDSKNKEMIAFLEMQS